MKSLATDRVIAVHYAEIEILDAKALATQAGQFDAALWSGLEEDGLKSPGGLTLPAASWRGRGPPPGHLSKARATPMRRLTKLWFAE